jgi:hypothetical protein
MSSKFVSTKIWDMSLTRLLHFSKIRRQTDIVGFAFGVFVHGVAEGFTGAFLPFEVCKEI